MLDKRGTFRGPSCYDVLVIAALIAAAILLPPIPGAYNLQVKQSTISSTVCVKGWTATVRPPQSYTSPIKRELLKSQNLPGTVSDYQLDHLISLELGGSPRSRDNLWMEPIVQAHRVDPVESALKRAVCDRDIRLSVAQKLELAWKRTFG